MSLLEVGNENTIGDTMIRRSNPPVAFRQRPKRGLDLQHSNSLARTIRSSASIDWH